MCIRWTMRRRIDVAYQHLDAPAVCFCAHCSCGESKQKLVLRSATLWLLALVFLVRLINALKIHHNILKRCVRFAAFLNVWAEQNLEAMNSASVSSQRSRFMRHSESELAKKKINFHYLSLFLCIYQLCFH